MSNTVWGDRLEFPEDNPSTSLIILDIDTTTCPIEEIYQMKFMAATASLQ